MKYELYDYNQKLVYTIIAKTFEDAEKCFKNKHIGLYTIKSEDGKDNIKFY